MAAILKDVYDQAYHYMDRVRSMTSTNTQVLQLHISYLTMCLVGSEIAQMMKETVVNNRFFYVRDGVGDVVCPIAAEAAWRHLRHQGPSFMTVGELIQVVHTLPNNPSTAGFAVEGVVLGTLKPKGIGLGNFSYPRLQAKSFSGIPLTSASDEETFLHLPNAFNFESTFSGVEAKGPLSRMT
ncbi:hypothetical protein EX30DRAFT_89634 [Ascodesmis nigricans]|uniref:Uncharacterized protein n=1 Tax=Ascodesmis nigricans TaxID=341454 RepID=A0A4S2N389_9PEZI|nr:hypothetical protein EX30DRAFT_89634 [Ascodesmis nigricans]